MDAVCEARALYDLWASSYPPVAHNALMRTEQEVVGSLLRSLRPTRALDVGTGSGRYLPQLIAAGATTVVGLDFSRPMLDRGPRCGGRVCGDARRLPFRPACFDVVNASLMAGDIPDLPAWTAELAAVLTRGGHLVYSDFHPTWNALGWRRTFRSAGGEMLEVPYVSHGLEDHRVAVREAKLDLMACHELPLTGDDAAARAFLREWGRTPVVVVVHAVKAA